MKRANAERENKSSYGRLTTSRIAMKTIKRSQKAAWLRTALLVRGAQSQVVTQQLHDQSGILVRRLLRPMQGELAWRQPLPAVHEPVPPCT